MSALRANPPLVVGIDVATAEVRVVVCDPLGAIRATASVPLPAPHRPRPGWADQDARRWWPAVAAALRQATAALGPDRAAIAALATSATSGTVVATDTLGAPLAPALLSDDRRAADDAARADAVGRPRWEALGVSVAPCSALAKAAWLARAAGPRRWRLAHVPDVVGRALIGTWPAADWSHALKSGWDPLREEWALECTDALGVPRDALPPVAAPATLAGVVSEVAAAETGLPAGCEVRLGMTDGCAAQLAAGSTRTGRWVTVLGTTMVIKGVSGDLLHDPTGAVSSHRHPDGAWLPGGASNTGGEALAHWGRDRWAALDRGAAATGPATVVAWPLRRSGERFPVLVPDATGFVDGEPRDDADAYRADLEGVAYLERLAYERLAALGGRRIGAVVTAGGGSRSRVWSTIRATVLGDGVRVVGQAETALGAALLAATGTVHPDLATATKAMVAKGVLIEPARVEVEAMADGYGRFRAALRQRGWLDRAVAAH